MIDIGLTDSTMLSLSYNKCICNHCLYHTYIIPAKPLHNCDIVSVHFKQFHWMGICDKLSRHLSMLTFIYLNVDEC